MSDPVQPAPDSAAEVAGASSADQRFAEVLRGTSSPAELRRELQRDGTEEAKDLLARLDALEFVQDVVGQEQALPEQIGGYQVRGLLGSGGMGTVYLAWQPELEREVALKVLAPSYASDPTMRKRFRAEARATAALHHRHIVPIYDYGEAQGMLFFAMERVDGKSLDKHIAAARRAGRRPMAPLEAARRFAGVADALGLAHRRRLLHRDVKPGNVLVASDGTLALTDFGLAKALDQEASVRLTSRASSGGFLGTLHYASPEQALGGELTPSSDLYSLGVTIFEAVSGELPISGRSPEALLQSILYGTPRRLRDCLPRPPRDLEAVLDKLLAREPRDRYQDGEALARDLQRIADGEPVHIRRLPLHVRLWRRARKNPVLASALAAVVVLLLATATLLFVLRLEKGQSLVSRHQNNLVAIAQEIGRELGPPWGPAPLFQALTGIDLPAISASAPILTAIARADAELPDDPNVQAMRRAYVDDPEPTASALLRDGRGYEAMQIYDRAIAAAVTARIGGDLAGEVRLYRLYLGRGVARLQAAVALPNEARTDLALASYLRPGAAFPQALLDVLDLVQSADVTAAARRIERELQRASTERVRTVATLLWAAAAQPPLAGANLMDFGLGFQKRRVLHDLAVRLGEDPPGPSVRCGQPTGLAAVFARVCGEALERLADPAALRELAEQTSRSIERAVHPLSPQQGWRYLLQLLLQPRQRGPLVGRDLLPLSPALQLATWENLLALEPRPEMVRLWLPRFDDFRRNHPSLPGLLRAAARMHLLAGSPETRALVNQWIIEAEGDPEAMLCRMQVLLLAGELEAARDDAMVAVQQSTVPHETLLDIARRCLLVAGDLEPGLVEAVRLMAQQFRNLAEAGPEAYGGGR